MKGMKLVSDPQVRKLPPSQRGDGTPFMAEHLEEALTGGSSVRTQLRDSDMSAFNKLVSSMKASGTLPTHPKIKKNNVSIYNDQLHTGSVCMGIDNIKWAKLFKVEPDFTSLLNEL